MMTNAVTPNSSQEELNTFSSQMKDVANLLNNNPEAAKLLSDAQAGLINEQQLLMALMKL